MATVAGAAGWKEGVAQANEWQLVPRAALDALPDTDTVIGRFGGAGGGIEFAPDDIPGLADYFAAKDGDA